MASRLDWSSVVGQKFGELTILSVEGRDSASKMRVRCQCSCGTQTTVRYNNLQGRTTSCGHVIREKTVVRNTIHGLSGHPDFQVWVDMNKRCHGSNPNFTKNYKDRGIFVCSQWRHDPAQFFNDMGPRPKGMTLERINNAKGYSPDNCAWVPMKTQQNNKRTNIFLEFQGVRRTISQWAQSIGMSKSTLSFRLNKGMSVEEALTKPIDTSRSRAKEIPLAANDTITEKEAP